MMPPQQGFEAANPLKFEIIDRLKDQFELAFLHRLPKIKFQSAALL